ncbi:MAG: hypothetical protein BWK79_08990 [Beggiatoa sp. IS2]|nr:MAG: hypothetical protein BWK79_08990 [Beggiatoa sp. IS2]
MIKENLSIPLSSFSSETLKTPFLLQNKSAYLAWRAKKLADYPDSIEELVLPIKNVFALTAQEYEQIITQCRKTNFVVYQLTEGVNVHTATLQALAKQFGLCHIDSNLCADDEGIAALQVAQGNQAQEYIPYTNRPLNWHTDGRLL